MPQVPVFFTGFIIFAFGLMIGSFLNVVIYRVPEHQSIVLPSSHCPSCNAAIKPYDNIPVLSYLLLRGRCRFCDIRISPVYPAVELLVGILYLLVFLKDLSTSGVGLVADLIFVSLIVPIVFIDLRHKLILNVITYPGLLVLFALRTLAPDPYIVSSVRALFGLASRPDWQVSMIGSLLGALAGGGSLWIIRELFFRLRNVEGMGLGDVKMMLMVGAFLGWQLTLLTIFIGSFTGSVIGLLLVRFRGGTMKTELPFGVFLGPAAIVAQMVGWPLIRLYLQMFK